MNTYQNQIDTNANRNFYHPDSRRNIDSTPDIHNSSQGEWFTRNNRSQYYREVLNREDEGLFREHVENIKQKKSKT